jgi:hypothetical protein
MVRSQQGIGEARLTGPVGPVGIKIQQVVQAAHQRVGKAHVLGHQVSLLLKAGRVNGRHYKLSGLPRIDQ